MTPCRAGCTPVISDVCDGHVTLGKLVIMPRATAPSLASFRSVGIFQEHATARIAEDLFRLLAPKRLVVRTAYNPRGGFETVCTVTLPAGGAGA